MKTISVKEKEDKAFEAMKGDFHYKNRMQGPRLTKVIVSVGTGSNKDKKRNELVVDRLAKITGQKAATRTAKKAIASFKTRVGDTVGQQITLRGARMYGFLDKLFNISLPRTKDFRGFAPTSVDAMGNVTLGVKEHTIFPETSDEDIKDVFGMAITIVSTAKSKTEAQVFFTHLGVPFRKE